MDTKKCIWMEAGAVDYQLCPLNQNCDLCDYHKNMTLGQRPNVLQSYRNKIKLGIPDAGRTQFIPGLQYLNGHFWIKRVASGKIRLGIDAFLWRLFSSIQKVVTLKTSTVLTPGQCFSWLVIDNGIIYLKTPVSGQIFETNPLFQEGVIQDVYLYPMSELWLLGLEGQDQSPPLFLSKEKYLLQNRADFEKLITHFPAPVKSNGLPILRNPQLEKGEFSEYLQGISFNHAFIC